MFEVQKMSPYMLPALTDGELDENDMDLIVTTLDEINTRHDDEMYFVIGNRADTVELLGCPSEVGLLKIAHAMNIFVTTQPSIVIRAVIYDPRELPYGIPHQKSIIVIFGEHTLKVFHHMYDAMKFIENTLAEYDQGSIMDFAVLIGDELEFNDKEWDTLMLSGRAAYGGL